jgi:hypothetical protein
MSDNTTNSNKILENAKNMHAKLQLLQKTLASGIEKSLDKIDNTLETGKIKDLLHYLETTTKRQQHHQQPYMPANTADPSSSSQL